jgi:hypothetical protein
VEREVEMTCPHCGEEVAADALVCRECGSDRDTGWAPHADNYGLLPSEAGKPKRSFTWVVAAAVALLAFVAFVVGGGIALSVVVAAGALALGGARFIAHRPAPRADTMRELVTRARGDAALASRLLEAELARRPEMTRAQAARLAVARLDRDRR